MWGGNGSMTHFDIIAAWFQKYKPMLKKKQFVCTFSTKNVLPIAHGQHIWQKSASPTMDIETNN